MRAKNTPALKPVLGLASLVFYGVGMILGAGVYSVVGAAAAHSGPGLWQSFAIAALVAALTGFSYAELATMHRDSGAEYAYLRRAFPKQRWVAFAIGLIVSCIGAATAATVALAFASYAQNFVAWPTGPTAFGLLSIMTALNLIGVQNLSRFNAVFTLIEASGIGLVIWLGASQGNGFGDAIFVPPVVGLLPAAALIFFSFLGFENIANLAEEAREPGKQIPRAILISICVTTVLYVLLGLAVVALLPLERLAASKAPLAEAAAMVSPLSARILSAVAMFATANTALISILAASRIIYSMARGNDLPGRFAQVSAKSGIPSLAVAFVAMLSAALLLFERLEVVAGIASLGSLSAFFSAHVALVVLRYREPKAKRPFHTPGALGRLPLLPLLGIALILVLVTRFESVVYLAFGGALAAFSVFYVLRPGR